MQTEAFILAVAALEDLKAQDIVTIDVRGKTSVTDYMVIASGGSSRQVKALADNVLEKVKEQGVRPLGSEGLEGGAVGPAQPGRRGGTRHAGADPQFYDLERLWQGAEQSRAQHSHDPE
ncbi:Ribosomal silencing factor RsfS OS=Stutzerimonas stutzeri OX=316 GN=rsfS PE=3 SV=1 [Stutzerimonas stutzeri]